MSQLQSRLNTKSPQPNFDNNIPVSPSANKFGGPTTPSATGRFPSSPQPPVTPQSNTLQTNSFNTAVAPSTPTAPNIPKPPGPPTAPKPPAPIIPISPMNQPPKPPGPPPNFSHSISSPSNTAALPKPPGPPPLSASSNFYLLLFLFIF